MRTTHTIFSTTKAKFSILAALMILSSSGLLANDSIHYKTTDDWQSGFVAEITVTNPSQSTSQGWQIELTFPYEITNIWNAEIVSHHANTYVITNAPYNAQIDPSQSISFGFQGTPGNVETAPVIASYSLDNASSNDSTPESSEPSNEQESPFTQPEEPLSGAFNYSVTSDWGSGFNADVTLTNEGASPSESWRIEFDYPYEITSIWNADIISHSGNHYIIRNKEYNAAIEAGQSTGFGYSAQPGNATTLPTNVQITLGQNSVTVDDPVITPPVQEPEEEVVEEESSAQTPPVVIDIPAVNSKGYFHTSGNQILDSEGNIVRIAGVNWFGFESSNFAPHGLWSRNYKEMMDQMLMLGFNTIRLPICNEMFDAGKTATGVDGYANPDLKGLTPPEILDKIVDYAGEIGLRIILDHHRSAAGMGALGAGLWYTDAYPEERWISDWKMLASRYLNKPAVIGADIHNEPHGAANWGQGGNNDWKAAAERCGNAIHSVNPNWLIFVTGVEFYDGKNYWWGGNLAGVKEHPVVLNVPNQLVYAPHAYPNSIYSQSWFSDPNYPNNLTAKWDEIWGYIYKENIAPVLIGEFGSKFEDEKDILWMEQFTHYLNNVAPEGKQGINWTWWSWNPNSGDTGGILKDDWTSVHQFKVDNLKALMFDMNK